MLPTVVDHTTQDLLLVYAAKVTQIATPSTGNGPVPDAVPRTAAPLFIQQSWICCDKCQKWRLLPYGHNPDKLPRKWLCSMLYWWPGMNSCDFSEEETDRTVKALYQSVHVPESQNSLNTHSDHGAVTEVTLTGLQNVDKTHRGGDIHGAIRREIKKLKLVEPEYATMHGHTDPTHFSKEGPEASVNSSAKSQKLT